MGVTPIGWALLLTGMALVVLRPAWLYVVTIFFLPFTATEVLNVGSGPNASGLQAAMFFGSLLLMRQFYVVLTTLRIRIPLYGRSSLLWLAAFVATTALSLVMPLWLDGHVQIPAQILGDFSSTPLYLKSANVTGVLYLVYGFCFACFIAYENQKPGMLRVTLKAFLAGSIFSACWGLVELGCKVSGITYPAIFNNGIAISTQGYLESLSDSVFRLSSVAVEPSIFAQALLVAVALYMPFALGRLTMFGKIRDRCFLAVLVMVLLLTTSSTAYVGIFVLTTLVLALLAIRGVLSPKYIAVPLLGVAAIASLYFTLPIARSVLDAALFTKASGGSAAERLMTVNNTFEMFQKYPLLGVGWASVPSHDLIVNILGNAGLLGLFTFSASMFCAFRALFRSIQSRRNVLQMQGLMQMDFALYIALAVTLATSALSGFLNTFSFFWFIVGLAVAGSNRNAFSSQSLQG